ncbi:MAG TPA: zf-TFIIB domain-containing protein [Candidatus Gastranaerophilales bacterium]|nr:zf-TFIIB domain-containing protein [Candidatus Gastranaerophilales bacterium]
MSFKPSPEEQKWAKRQEMDIRKKLQGFLSRQKFPEIIGLESICPADGNGLEKVEIDDTGIFVYKCVYCGGIWINRRDMEKLLHSSEKSDKLVKYIAKILNIKT